ncbi:hypothetical protein [Salinigranum sp. GCM10025319]|uniref:hypothetical protein n=1 Tax=Salinigranum sp. GCM10025319 TaxID=3252687 RepID=UPI0036225CD5
MTERAVVLVVGLVLVATLVGVAGVGVSPTAAAAAGVGDSSITPTTVDTGAKTTLSFSAAVEGVDTSDGTADGRVTFAVADAVDLSGARVTSASVTPNATAASGTVDADAGTVAVTWDDDAGVESETLTVDVTVEGVVVRRTGSSEVSVAVDADATGGTDLTASIGSVTAVASGSDRSVRGKQATLYLGERAVDVTGVDGASPAGASQSFYGVGSEAEGSTAAAADTAAVDVTAANRFVPGVYSLSPSSDDGVITVRRPRVTGLTVYGGASTAAPDVTNRSVPRGTTTLTVETEFTFDDAGNVTLTVEDGDGIDVTDEVAASPTVTRSGGTTTLDVGDLPVGRYDVTAEGVDDLDNASLTAPFRVRDPEKVVTLSKTRVVRGENTIVSVAGAPGDVRYLRLSGAALRSDAILNTATAREVFDRTAQVRSVGVARESNTLYAVIALDDDGISEVRLRTGRLVTDSVDVELAPEVDGPTEDEVTLDVAERGVTVSSIPTTTIGETVSVSGTAPESDRVKLYAEVDGQYVPLYAEARTDALAEPDVKGDGTWTTDVDTSAVVALAGSYRVVAVGDPGSTRLGSTDVIDSETLGDLDPRGSSPLTTVEGGLSLSASRTEIAATGADEFTLSGIADEGDDLRLYHVGPRGTVTARVVDADAFEETIDGIETRGVHTFVVVGDGRDGEYAYAPGSGPSVDGLVSGRETQSAALEKLRDAYTGPGSDDVLASVDVTGVEPTLSVTTPSENGSVPVGDVSIVGRSTSEDGTTVFVELLGSDARVVRSTEVPVTNGTWNATLDLSAVGTGSYRLAATDGERRDSLAVTVSEEASRPGNATGSSGSGDGASNESTPVEEATPAETPGTATDASDSTATTTSGTTGTTSTEFPGLGAAASLGALAVVLGVLALRARLGRSRR